MHIPNVKELRKYLHRLYDNPQDKEAEEIIREQFKIGGETVDDVICNTELCIERVFENAE